MTMTRAKSEAAIWLLIFLAWVVSIVDAPAQSWSVGYNPNTGALSQPASGKTPLIFTAATVIHTTDADVTLGWRTSYASWEVPGQTDVRVMNLPEVGTDPGEFAPGRVLLVTVVDTAGQLLSVEDSTAGPIAETSAGVRWEFRAVSSGVWEVRVIGTASEYNVGTSGGVVGLLNGNWVKSGTTRFDGTVTLNGIALLADVSGVTKLEKYPSFDGWRVTGGAGSMFLAGAYWQGDPLTGQHTLLYDNGDLALTIAAKAGNTIRFDAGLDGSYEMDVTAAGVRIGNGTRAAIVDHGVTPALSSGTYTVMAPWVTASTRIIPSWHAEAGTTGVRLSVSRSAGISFTITSKDASGATATGDTSTISWIAIVP